MIGRVIRRRLGSKPTARISDITLAPQKVLNKAHEQSEGGSTRPGQIGSVTEGAIAR